MGTTLVPISADYDDITTLAGLRKAFVDDSGRTDLVTGYPTDYIDNGANRLINAAIRWLDRECDHPKVDGWLYKAVTETDYTIAFQACRYVKEVRLEYPYGPKLKWRQFPVIIAPDQIESATPDALDNWIVEGQASYPYSGIQIQWPVYDPYNIIADAVFEPFNVCILAAWKSQVLADDQDKCFWSVQEPDLVVEVTRAMAEGGLQNFSGKNGFLQSVIRDCKSIAADYYTEQLQGMSRELPG